MPVEVSVIVRCKKPSPLTAAPQVYPAGQLVVLIVPAVEVYEPNVAGAAACAVPAHAQTNTTTLAADNIAPLQHRVRNGGIYPSQSIYFWKL